MKNKVETVATVSEWDTLVSTTYKRPYNFQQQDDCKEPGTFRFTVPDEAEDFPRNEVPEIVNHKIMGVSFAAWLDRDPSTPLTTMPEDWKLALWWQRNFYPNVQMIANDLHAKGLLAAGDYAIEIDW